MKIIKHVSKRASYHFRSEDRSLSSGLSSGQNHRSKLNAAEGTHWLQSTTNIHEIYNFISISIERLWFYFDKTKPGSKMVIMSHSLRARQAVLPKKGMTPERELKIAQAKFFFQSISIMVIFWSLMLETSSFIFSVPTKLGICAYLNYPKFANTEFISFH